MIKRPRLPRFRCPAVRVALAGVLVVSLGNVRLAGQPPSDARRLLQTGRYAEALEAFRRMEPDQPAVAAVGVARCLESKGRFAQARQTLQAFLQEHDPSDYPEVMAEAARLAWTEGDLTESERWLRQSLDADPALPLARWIQIELRLARGEIDEALAAQSQLAAERGRQWSPEQMLWIGQAAARHARWKPEPRTFERLVNRWYPDILQQAPDLWQAHLQRGLLFLEKHNEADALDAFNAALAINPQAAEIHVARARLALDRFQLDSADRHIQRALRLNERCRAALQLQADMWVLRDGFQAALDALEQASQWNPRDLQTEGRLAAVYLMLDGGTAERPTPRAAQVIERMVESNPACGMFFAVMGDALERARRYPDAIWCFRQARQRMPALLPVRAQLGLALMRMGDEAAAREELEAAFVADPYHVRVKNSLEVLDVLAQYATLETDHFVIRFDRGQQQLLAELAAEYLESEVYAEVVDQMQFAPAEKTLIEIFSRARNSSGHSWFSARTVGLPFLGPVAACPGQMIAMTAPDELPEEGYPWGRTLKHEFVHIVNLQQTGFRIPHWFTEGLAVRIEGQPRPSEWERILAQRRASDQLFDLATIHLGFLRPASADDWTLAYCQAELYTDYMVARFGDGACHQLIDAYARGLPTSRAIQQAFGVDVETFEAGYREFIGTLMADLPSATLARTLPQIQQQLQADPQNPQLMADLAEALLETRQWDAARQWAERARDRQPDLPHAAYVLARLQLAGRQPAAALELLEQAARGTPPHEQAVALLVAVHLDQRQFSAAGQWCRYGMQQLSSPRRWLELLARVQLLAGDQAGLAETLGRLVQGDSENRVLLAKLQQLALERQDWAAARRWANQILRLDVLEPSAHRAIVAAWMAEQQWQAAHGAVRRALLAVPGDPALTLDLAEVMRQTGQQDEALQKVRDILDADPQNARAAALWEQWSK